MDIPIFFRDPRSYIWFVWIVLIVMAFTVVFVIFATIYRKIRLRKTRDKLKKRLPL
jgi:heme/copper-type cytochrome/quinol oxidase subunit 2